MDCVLRQQHDGTTEAAPPGYLVADDINDNEGDTGRLFACPEIGCDGFTFDTINECHIHLKDWHNPPYSCSECKASFAAMPALKRHFKNTGHYNWICQEEMCEMKGILFANRSEFVAHALRAGGHERLFPTEGLNSPVSPKRLNYAEVIHIPCEDTTSESSEEEAYQCSEPSCRRYQQLFHSENEFSKHEESHAHINAVKYSEDLRESERTAEDITAEQEAAREFRCTTQGCSSFGEKLKTSQSFYRHIHTAKHVYPFLSSVSNPTSPTAEIRQHFHQLNLACDEPECPRYEHRFANYVNLTKHKQSVPHLKAVSYGQSKKNAVYSDNIATHILEESQSEVTTAIPSTPVRWSSYSFAPITPTTNTTTRIAELPDAVTPTRHSIRNISPLTPPPPSTSSSSSSWREESLMKKNGELENEVQQLKSKIERLRTAYKEQISSLFQALGEKQGREL